MKASHYLSVALFALALIGGYFAASGRLGMNLDQFAPKAPGGDFELQSLQGPVTLSEFRNKVVLIYFGYTHCPDICPTALSLTNAGFKQLEPAEQEQVQMLLISVDPKRDSVERLEEYTGFFHPTMLGLTGSIQQIDDVTRRFGAYYSIPAGTTGDNYAVDHSSQTVVIGKDGEIKENIAHGTAPDQVVATVRKYL